MAMGCDLVGDDRTLIDPDLTVYPPAAIAGLIEARGIGLIQTPYVTARLCAVVDLDQVETARLPDHRVTRVHNHDVPLLFRVESVHFPVGLLHYMKGDRQGS